MNVTVKRFLFVLSACLILQLATYHLIGKKQLIASFDVSYKELLSKKYPRVVLVYCNCGVSIEPLKSESIELLEPVDVYQIEYEKAPQLSEKQKLALELKLKTEFNSVTTARNHNEIDKLFVNESILYYLCIDYTFYFKAYVDETVHAKGKEEDSLFGADWQTEYVWVLFKWFKVKKNSLGIS